MTAQRALTPVTLTVALGNLTAGTVEPRVIPSSPLPATESPRPASRSQASASAVASRPHRGRHRGPMGSVQSWFRAVPPVRRCASVCAGGRRVSVACAGDRPAPVALTDDADAHALTRLAAGSAVEILAWRPRGSDGTRYHVQSTRNGREGGLAGHNVRSTPAAGSAPTEPLPAATGCAAATRGGIGGVQASVRSARGLTKMGSAEGESARNGA
jgi:hypothetical protein